MNIFLKIIAGLSVMTFIVGCSNDSPIGVASNEQNKTAVAITLGEDSYFTAAYDSYYGSSYAFVTANDHNLYYKVNQRGEWWPIWVAMPIGSITGMISSVYQPVQGNLFVFSRSTNTNQLKYIYESKGGNWSDWTTTGPRFSGDIKVKKIFFDEGFRIIVKNSDDNKLNTIVCCSRWGTWSQIPDCPTIPVKFDFQYMGANNTAAIVIARGIYSGGTNWIFAIGLNVGSDIYSGAYTYWVPFSMDDNIEDLAMAVNADGRVEAFAIHSDYSLWHRYQTDLTQPNANNPIGNWSNWEQLTASNTCKSRLTAVTTPDGRIEVFFNSYPDGNLRHIYQTAPSSGWSPACDFENGTVQTNKPIATVPYPGNNRLSVFAVNPSNTVVNYSKQHSATEWWWDPFTSFGL
jgi:hypothetical protein